MTEVPSRLSQGQELVDEGARSTADLTQAAAEGLRWIAYARVIIEVALFGSAVILARMMPPAAFGIFAVIVIVQELAVTMPAEGVGGALVQRPQLAREHLQAGLAMTVLTGLAMAALTVVVGIVVVGPLFNHETEVLTIAQAPYFLMGAIYAVPIAVLRRRLDFRRVSIVETLQNTTRVLATIGLALLGLDAPALVFGCTIGMAVALVVALWFAPVPLPRWRTQAVRDLLPYGGPAALATFAWTGFRNGDYAVIGSVLGPNAAGLYWRGYQLAVEYQGKVAVPMVQMAFPVLARTEDTEELLGLRRRMVHLQTVVLFPLLVALLVLAPVVVPWLFGADWEGAVVPTQILVAGGAASLVINAAGSALQAEGRAKALLGYGVAHFVVYVGAVVAVAHMGLAAVAIAGSVVHGIFLAVAYVVLLGRREGNPLLALWRDLYPALAGCAAMAAVALPLELALRAGGAPVLLQTAAVCLAGGIAYVAVLKRWFPAAAHDLFAALRRVSPVRFGLRRRDGAPAGAEA
ncbi:MAG TPA: oligosaccharide flippase family protein [Solirubrobacterales bacterium]|nr:oligosaccharide flippase family protein [Solirubrobacterales bacterium]